MRLIGRAASGGDTSLRVCLGQTNLKCARAVGVDRQPITLRPISRPAVSLESSHIDGGSAETVGEAEPTSSRADNHDLNVVSPERR
jgi:hypothetical protein